MSIFKWQRIQFHQILIKTYNKYIQENEWPHTICGLGFESQAHHLRFNLFTFKLCDVKRTKINKKRPGLAHILIYLGKLAKIRLIEAKAKTVYSGQFSI